MDILSPDSPDNNPPQKHCTGPCRRMLPATPEFFYPMPGHLRAKCKVCSNSESKAYRDVNKERLKEYWQTNKEHAHQREKAYRAANKERYQAYREANKERRAQNMKTWKQANQDHLQTYREANQEHIRQYEKAYKQAHSEQRREQKLMARYGITLAEYEEMFMRQFGLCAICGRPPKNGKPLHVDHCHKTGLLRELICMHCNSLLGYADDNSAVLKRAIKYLERHST